MTARERWEHLRAVAAAGLPGADRRLPSTPFCDTAWRQFLLGVAEQRLEGHLAEAVTSGGLATTRSQAAEVAERHAAAMAQVLRLDRILLQTAAVLEAAAVEYRVMKGAAFAHTVYPNPASRVYGDVDFLVPADQFDTAVAALSASGYQRPWPQLRPGFDRRFGKGATFVAPDGHEVDLHRTFALGPFGLTIDLRALFARPDTVRLGGRVLPTLGQPERFLLACYHAALGNARPRLVPLRDTAQLVLNMDVKPDDVLRQADAWGGQAVVARAVSLAWEEFALSDAVPLSVWAQRYEPTRKERRAVATYHQGEHRFAAKAVASLHVIDGLAAKLAYLRAVAIPERGAVSRYEPGYGQWWRRGGRALLQRVGHR